MLTLGSGTQWSLQVDGPDLWRLGGNNFYPEQGQALPQAPEDIDVDQVRIQEPQEISLPWDVCKGC